MGTIVIDEENFYELMDKLYDRLKDQYGIKVDKWVSGTEAMRMLRTPARRPSRKCEMKAKSATAKLKER